MLAITLKACNQTIVITSLIKLKKAAHIAAFFYAIVIFKIKPLYSQNFLKMQGLIQFLQLLLSRADYAYPSTAGSHVNG
jgi:hypothetical protein